MKNALVSIIIAFIFVLMFLSFLLKENKDDMIYTACKKICNNGELVKHERGAEDNLICWCTQGPLIKMKLGKIK